MIRNVGGFPSGQAATVTITDLTTGSVVVTNGSATENAIGASGTSSYYYNYAPAGGVTYAKPGHQYLWQWTMTVGGVVLAGDEMVSIEDTAALGIYGQVVAGTLTSSLFTVTMDNSQITGFASNQYVKFITGTLAGQVRKINAFTSGSPASMSMIDSFTSSPSVGDQFCVTY